MFQTGDCEQRRPFPTINQQIEITVLRIRARQYRAKNARPHHIVPANEFTQFIPVGGQGLRRSHVLKLSDSRSRFNNSPRHAVQLLKVPRPPPSNQATASASTFRSFRLR